MKKLLRLSSLLFTAVLLTCFARESQASHVQGTDLTYQAVAPNTYVVTLKVYRDCTGASAPTTASLNLRSPGCNNGRSQAMTKVGANKIGNLYCPQLGAPQCTSTGKPNFEEVTFTTTLTFTTAEQACTDWTLSWNLCCRPSLANITNAQSFDLYSEAFLKLGLAMPNSSPEFSPLNVPIPLVCLGQQTRYSLNASEADGDSLLYELVQPLDDANTPTPYAVNPQAGTAGSLIQNANPKPPYSNPFAPQYAVLTGTTPANFTPTYPMPSVVVNWSGPATVPYVGAPNGMVWAATPDFRLNPENGELTFTPSHYVPNSPANQGLNKYAVVVKITEFREIPANCGTWVKVGHIRRDLMFIVEDCGGNVTPTPTVPPIPPKFNAAFNDTLFTVQTCNTTRLRLKYVDPNEDNITITLDQNQINRLPQGSVNIIGQGTDSVTVEVLLTPNIADAGKRYTLGIQIEDDACPIKNSQTEVYTIQVERNHFAQVTGNQTRAICLGESSPIDITLERPDSLLMVPAEYNFSWTLANPSQAGTAGLDPADLNKEDITVTPTQPGIYKYILTVIPNSANPAVAGCVDTTSVTVVVDDIPRLDDITLKNVETGATLNEIKFGRSGQLDVVVANPSPTYTYSWSPGRFLNDSTLQNPIATPFRTTDFTV
ncbi:MAG TPA: hypothetical protein VK927_11220, partial [Adhaeribacter sp.]|nr:hypothetical protein [Adhaeribacter sp.]